MTISIDQLFKYSLVFIMLAIVTACGNDDDSNPNPDPDNFDRRAMLINWADNIITPGYNDLTEKTEILKTAALIFVNTPNAASLNELRNAWEDAYITWQRVSMFEIGEAESLRLRNNLNIYPTDVDAIMENIETGNYDLTLSSFNDQQGFPALDYLLYGIGANDTEIINAYSDQAYRDYLEDLTERIDFLADQVLASWTGPYRDAFVDNDGNSATASVDMLVNDYVFYYEKALRAGKVGIPAGVFSGMPLEDRVEAFYRKDLSKTLFLEALQASQDFFNGKHYNSSTNGQSLSDYLDYLNTIKNGTDLTTLINNQFETIRTRAGGLNDNFVQQIQTDNDAMLRTYDDLQVNVILLKVDMMQALNINVDYVDADGD